MTSYRLPGATYRLQFNSSFTFQHSADLIDYFSSLGITDCYASPILKARAGSIHGYDVLDYGQVNPELGGEEAFISFAKQLKEKNIGLLLDIVPNHMCISEDTNKWWQDVLENGPSSLYASYFNIVWNPLKAKLYNKVLLPVLDQQYGRVIENQELKLIYEKGAFFVAYKTRHFPVNPYTWCMILDPVSEKIEAQEGASNETTLEFQSILTALRHLPDLEEIDADKIKERNREKEIIKKRLAVLTEKSKSVHVLIEESLHVLNGKKGEPHSFDQLEELLGQQAYRLSYWRVTNDEINYRRFFDINDLASVRVEEEAVFQELHALVLTFIKEGWVTGLRVDHVDGLFDPEGYLCRLQYACAQTLEKGPSSGTQRTFYAIVEKILMGNERLRPRWMTDGTTGYDFLNLLNGLYVVRENKQAFQHTYYQFISRYEELHYVIYECKKLILFVSMSSELHLLARQLEEISEQHRWSRDFTLETLRIALREIIACFPAYRSYIRLANKEVSDEDQHLIVSAIRQAKRYNPASESSEFDFIQSVLLLQYPEGVTEEQIAYRQQFIMRFQQLTGPVMAKGFEDTAFYRHYPLISLNEVGKDPGAFGVSIDTFHEKNKERLEYWPHTLLTTFTHDTKRSEDVRARINVLTEDPQGWHEALYRWQKLNQIHKFTIDGASVPDNNEEYLLYQTLVGSWPLGPNEEKDREEYVKRIQDYMIKALKEAKIHTSWINPNQLYEEAIIKFVALILNPKHAFTEDLLSYIKPIKRAGLFNSLSQLLLKSTVPGIPDFYQGSELWEFTLVDPDNRKPVNYALRKQMLQSIRQDLKNKGLKCVEELIDRLEDGRIKQYIQSTILSFRQQYPNLFYQGSYEPLIVEGGEASKIIAFRREAEFKSILVLTGRFFLKSLDSNTLQLQASDWKDVVLKIPPSCFGQYKDILTGREWLVNDQQTLSIEQLFTPLPFVLLEKIC